MPGCAAELLQQRMERNGSLRSCGEVMTRVPQGNDSGRPYRKSTRGDRGGGERGGRLWKGFRSIGSSWGRPSEAPAVLRTSLGLLISRASGFRDSLPPP